MLSDEELMTGYRRFGQRLEGHPTPVLPWVDVATGSLGQGLPDGVGIALSGKYLEHLPFRVWVLCGDSELAEGSIWEAIDKASYYKLSNLVVMADINRLGQRGPTDLGWDVDDYKRRFEAFGARALVIDGHDLSAIDGAFAEAENMGGERPTVIVAKTIKGRGFSEVENKEGWHGKPFPPDMAERAIKELGGERHLVVRCPLPDKVADRPQSSPTTAAAADLPRYDARRLGRHPQGLRRRLVAIGAADPRVVVLDAEVSNSTHADEFKHAFPDRYFEMFISEQQLVAAATGLNVRGFKTFASTFAAFFTRAFDFVRMGAISGVDLRLSGSHCGVEIGADGPSQMGLEDLAMMRTVHGSTVLYPSDATSTAALVAAMARQPRDQLHPHHTRRVSRDLRGARGVRGRRFEGSTLLRARRRHAGGRRRHAPRVLEGGGAARGRGDPGSGRRLLLGQTDRHCHALGSGGSHVRKDRRGGGPPSRGRTGIGRDRMPLVERSDEPPHRPPGGQGHAGLGHRGGAHRVGRHRR